MSDVDTIKERLGIVDVVSSYIKIEKAGLSYKACCPFHNEKTPSLNISSDRNLYYCFGCGAKGDIFTFVQDFEGLDFQGALKMLADKAGVELTGSRKGSRGEREKLYKVMEEAAIFYSSKLSDSEIAQSYLKDRGVSENTIKEFRIGVAPEDWTSLHDVLIERGYSEALMEKAGLIKRSDKNESKSSRYYDRFRNRIMFPISDSAGRIVAFSGRALDPEEKTGKYINSPETDLYNKSDVLYGYDKAKLHIKKFRMCILVEGQFDLILAHQEGFPCTVASSGTSFTGGHLNRIRRLTDNLLIAFDRDRAGVMSMSKTSRMALGMGMNVNTLLLEKGADPADILKDKKEVFAELVKNSKHVVEVFLEEIAKKGLDQRQYWMQTEKHVLPLIASMSNSIDQAHFISRVHKKTEIPEKSIREELVKTASSAEAKDEKVSIPKPVMVESVTRKGSILRMLKAIVVWQSTSKNSKVDVDSLKTRIDLLIGEKQDYDLEVNDLQELIFKIEKVYTNEVELEKEVEDLLLGLEEDLISSRLLDITKKIRESEDSKHKVEVKQLMERHQKLSKRLDEVKNKGRN